MKIGIVINTKSPEEVWNAFRFANTGLNQKDKVKIFLMGDGVEIDNIRSKKFKVDEQVELFLKNNGLILACGTCMKLRKKKEKVCTLSTQKELLQMVKWADKVLTFG